MEARPTIAQAIDAIKTHPDLKPWQRRDYSSGLKRLTEALGLGADKPADGRYIFQLAARINHHQLDLAEGRYNTLLSNARKALQYATGIVSVRPINNVSEPWQALRKDLATLGGGWQAAVLSPFVRWCDDQGILPEDVNDGSLLAYLDYRITTSYVTQRRRLARKIMDAWNSCARGGSGWPATELTAGRVKSEDYLLDWNAFPVALRDDVEAYKAANIKSARKRKLSYADLVLDDGEDAEAPTSSEDIAIARERSRLAPLSASTLKKQTDYIRLIASTMVREGKVEPQDLISIGCVIKSKNVQVTLAAISARRRAKHDRLREQGRCGEIDPNRDGTEYDIDLVKHARNVALRWLNIKPVMMANFAKLLRESKKHGAIGNTVSWRNARALEFIRDDRLFGKVLTYPDDTYAACEKERKARGGVTLDIALAMLSAVAVAVLCSMPVRRGTLASTHIERNIRFPCVITPLPLISYSPEQVKNQKAVEWHPKPEVVRLLRAYVEHYRPVLLRGRPDQGYLFPGECNGHIAPQWLSTMVPQRVFDATGVYANLHLYRHAMATFVVQTEGGRTETAASVLGHSAGSLQTHRYAMSLRAELGHAALQKAKAQHMQKAIRATLGPSRRREA